MVCDFLLLFFKAHGVNWQLKEKSFLIKFTYIYKEIKGYEENFLQTKILIISFSF